MTPIIPEQKLSENKHVFIRMAIAINRGNYTEVYRFQLWQARKYYTIEFI